MKQQEPTVQVPMVQSSIEPASQPNSEVSQFINQGASSQRATKSKFGAWWWFVLPVVPLLLLGWAVWRNRKEQREKLAFEREQRRVAGNFLGTTGAGIVKPSEKPIKIREHKSATKDLSIKTQRASTENGRQLGTPISGFASSKTSANETVKQESGSRTTKVYKLTGQSEGSGPDDLTKISGIGQATQKFLNKQGINCFEQIAKMDGQQLKEIFAGSSRFQFLNPATWPAQAKEILQASLSCQEAEVLEDIKSISKSNSPTTQMPELKFGTILKDQKFTNPSK